MSHDAKIDKKKLSEPSMRYLNREISWLAFNTRVLEEAENSKNPLLERVNYLSISASNLDEFYMVRVAGLKDQIRHNLAKLSDDKKTPAEQLENLHKVAGELMSRQQKCWIKIRKELKSANIHLVTHTDISEKDREFISGYFMEHLFPVLTPIAIDPAHPFPFLPNLGIAMLFQLANDKGKEQTAIISFPQNIQRFVSLPGKHIRLIALEDILDVCLNDIFPGFTKLDSAMLRIVRDSDLDIEEAAEDLVRVFERAMKIRRRGRIIRIKTLSPISENLHQFIIDHLAASPQDVVPAEAMLGLSQLRAIYELPRPDLKFPSFAVRFPERITNYGGNCFAAIEAKDLVVHHPFESFDVVVQYLWQAAEDPDVISIKQTLYRTSKDSPIVKALIAAAEAGKSVTAVVELKARFDEEANIKWARDLERAGAQVVYGFVKLKTHAKISLITRKTESGLRSYVHFGTGNYHPNTAKIYTDLSFFTCDPKLCQDAAYFFNFVTGYAPPRALSKLVMAPKDMRNSLLKLIADEIAHAKAGRPAAIWAKMNALVDTAMIDALYEASQHGVKINLIVRGMCCLRPGVKGLSENITVKSIVGRFLEHARIFCFSNGEAMPSPKAKVFIASADWMPRNFDWRVEVMVPIENPTVHEQILSQIMTANIKDDKQSWLLQPDGIYKRAEGNSFSAHEYFMTNPSLSGRGKKLAKIKTDSKALPSPKPKGRKK